MSGSKQCLKHVASLPAFNIREKSRGSGNKLNKKEKRLGKVHSRAIFTAPKQHPWGSSNNPQLRIKRSVRKNKQIHRKKASLLLKSVNIPHQHAEYYQEDTSKEDKVKSSCFLSTHQSKESVGKMLASTRHNLDSERTLSRNNSRTAIEPTNALPLNAILTRTRNVLEQFRARCTRLEKSNRKLRQQLQQRLA